MENTTTDPTVERRASLSVRLRNIVVDIRMLSSTTEELIKDCQSEIDARNGLVDVLHPGYTGPIQIREAIDRWETSIVGVLNNDRIMRDLKQFCAQVETSQVIGRLPGEYWADVVANSKCPLPASLAVLAEDVRTLNPATLNDADRMFILSVLARRASMHRTPPRESLVWMWQTSAGWTMDPLTPTRILAQFERTINGSGPNGMTLSLFGMLVGDDVAAETVRQLAGSNPS